MALRSLARKGSTMKSIIILIALFGIACTKKDKVHGKEGAGSESSLAAITIDSPSQPQEPFSKAILSIKCVKSCATDPADTINPPMVDTEADSTLGFAKLNEKIKDYKYASGTAITVSLMLLDKNGKAVYQSCAGTENGCSEHEYTIEATGIVGGSFNIAIKLQKADPNTVSPNDITECP